MGRLAIMPMPLARAFSNRPYRAPWSTRLKLVCSASNRPELDRRLGLLVLLAVADQPGLARALGLQGDLDHLLGIGPVDAVGVYLEQIDVVGAQPRQATVDGLPAVSAVQGGPTLSGPVCPTLVARNELMAAVRDRAAEQLLAVAVALGRIQEVDPGVQRGAQDAPSLRSIAQRVGAHLGHAKAETAHFEPGSRRSQSSA